MNGEPWSDRADCAHPVRWSPADGDSPRYLTLAGAVHRLTRDNGDPDAIRAGLVAGRIYRTPFAFYKIDDDGPRCPDCAHPFPEEPCPPYCPANAGGDHDHRDPFPTHPETDR